MFVVLLAVCTRTTGGYSFWYNVFYLIPGAEAIRAVSRIVLLLLIPLAICSASVLERLHELRKPTQILFGLLLSAWIVSDSWIALDGHHKVSESEEGIQRVVTELRMRNTCKVFYLHRPGVTGIDFAFMQIDAMWASLLTGIPTVNGYSGGYPKKWLELGFISAPETITKEIVSEWVHLAGADVNAADLCVIH